MEKISSIIPSNNRISAVDLQEARPLRPGAPSHGQPVGRSEIVRFSKSALETVKDGQRTRSVTEERNVRIADTLAKKFFRDKTQEATTDSPVSATPVVQESIQNIEEPEQSSETQKEIEVSTPYLGDDLFDSDADKLERVTASAVSNLKSEKDENTESEQEVSPYSTQKKEIRSGILLDKKA